MFEFLILSPFCLKPFGFSRPGNFYGTIQDGDHRGRKASVANEKIGNTRFGTNRGRLSDFFMQPSRRRSLAAGTGRRNFVTKNQRARKPTDTIGKPGFFSLQRPNLRHGKTRNSGPNRPENEKSKKNIVWD